MKKLVLLILTTAIFFASCKKNEDAPAPSEVSCDEELELDALTEDSVHSSMMYIYGKNFFCLQDTLKILVTLENECTDKDSTVVVTLLKKDFENHSKSMVYFTMPRETRGQIGVSKAYFKIVHGTDTTDMTGNTPLQIYDIFYQYQKYATLGDSIVIRPSDRLNDAIKKVTLNGITSVFRAQNTINGYEYHVAVPSGLTEGDITMRAFSACDREIKAYVAADSPKTIYISKSHWFSFSQPVLSGADNSRYTFDVRLNKTETTSGTIVIQLKNKVTLEEETLTLSGYSYGNNQRSYYFYKPNSTQGSYTISVKKGSTTYESANGSTDLIFP